MFELTSKGNFNSTESWLKKLSADAPPAALKNAGEKGVAYLHGATPVDSRLTADSWYYKVEHKKGSWELAFYNSNVQDGANIAVILATGHATRNGGYVQGRNYINPGIQPIFDQLAKDVWKAVTS